MHAECRIYLILFWSWLSWAATEPNQQIAILQAFLEYGIPEDPETVFELMQKVIFIEYLLPTYLIVEIFLVTGGDSFVLILENHFKIWSCKSISWC